MKIPKTYDISGGDAFFIINDVHRTHVKASLQIDTDASFNGSTATVEFVQSNDIDLDPSLWHDLPEAPLTMPTGEGSSLLSTFSFTGRFLAVKVSRGDASAGILSFSNNFNANT